MNQKVKMSDDLRWVLGLLLRWSWLVVLLAVIGGVAAYLVSRSMTPMYEAKTVLMLNQPATYGTTNSDSLVTSEMLARTYSEVLLSRNVLGSVATDLNLKDTLENLRKMITVTSVRDTQLLTITVEYPDQKIAADIANALAAKFITQNQAAIDKQVVDTQTAAQVKIKNVEDQIASLQNELNSRQQKTYEERSQFVTKMMAGLQTEITTLQQEIVTLENDTTTVKNLDYYGRYVILTVTPDVNRRTNLSLKSERLDELKSLLQRYQTEYASLSVNQQASANLDPSAAQIQSLLNMYQNVYVQLKQDYDNLPAAGNKSGLQITQVENAITPTTPSKPDVIQNALMGIAGGIFLALLIIYLIEPLQGQQKSPEEVAERYHLPVLGGLFRDAAWNQLISERLADSPQVEAYRFLHAHLRQIGLQKQYQVILVTSPVPEDDKDKVAANLALVMAQSGTKVGLVDLDLHDPKIHKITGQPNEAGISDVISNPALDVAEVSRYLWEKQLGLITSGTPSPTPYRLVNSPRLGEIIAQLKERWDVVIINVPPILSVTDSLMVAGYADGILLVIKPGASSDASIDQAISHLNQTGTKIIGLVMNDVDSRQLKKQYHFYKSHRRMTGVAKESAPVPNQVSQD